MGAQEQEPSVLEKGQESEALPEQSRGSRDGRQTPNLLASKTRLVWAVVLGAFVMLIFRGTVMAVVVDAYLPSRCIGFTWLR